MTKDNKEFEEEIKKLSNEELDKAAGGQNCEAGFIKINNRCVPVNGVDD